MIYTVAAFLSLPFVILRLILKGFKEPEYHKNILERFGVYTNSVDRRDILWIHAVSVGEVYASQPLYKKIRQLHPNKGIVFTTTTPSGRKIAQSIFREKTQVIYLPLDIPPSIKKFLKTYKPKMGILIETEIWPNLTKLCKSNGIPLNLINARLSKISARKYTKLFALSRNTINQLSLIAAQTKEDARRFNFFVDKNIFITGSMKFDREVPKIQKEVGKVMRIKYDALRPIFLAASTRPGEEEIIIQAIQQIKNIPNLLTVIVPRHPNRSDKIARLAKSASMPFQKISHTTKVKSSTKIVLGDELGKLFAFYYSCDVAFVGGSLLPFGGQNFLEAHSVGKPVIIGPHVFNFKKIAREALKAGAVRQVKDYKQLAIEVESLITDPNTRKNVATAGINFLKNKQGATLKTIKLLGL